MITLYVELFDTEPYMMVVIINGHRFHGNGFSGDPNAMRVGQTYQCESSFYFGNARFQSGIVIGLV